MTDYQRGDVVFTRNADGTLTVWMWIQPQGQQGEFVNSYGQMVSAAGMEIYEPRKVISGGRLMPQDTK